MAVVEDLMIVQNRDRSAAGVKTVLREVIEQSVAMGRVSQAVVDAAAAQLTEDAARSINCDQRLAAVSISLTECEDGIEQLSPGRAREEAMRLKHLLWTTLQGLEAIVERTER
jgi:hypothetical protein